MSVILCTGDRVKDKKKSIKLHLPDLRVGYRILLYLCTLLVCCLSLYFSVTAEISLPAAILCYICAFLGLMVSVAYIAKAVRRFYVWVKSMILSNRYTEKVATNYRTRTFVLMVPGIVADLFYAIVNAYTGAVVHSAWFGSFAAYYILLSILRMYALSEAVKLRTVDEKQREKRETQIYFRFSILFLLFGWIVFGLTILLYHSKGSKSYPYMMIYAMAAYTFFRIFMSVRALLLTKKENSPLMMIVRKLGYMDACLSILILQVAMIGEFGNSSDLSVIAKANAMTGTIVTIMILGMGIQGIVAYKKHDSYNEKSN